MPAISIITPTWNRERFLPTIAACVLAQQVDWEWRVLDDSATPSAFMQDLARRDARVHYTHIPERLSIGTKRNQLIAQAQGEVIAHFDDDDYYGPQYLRKMQALLVQNGADMVKLSGFYMYAPQSGFLGYMDLNARTGLHYRLIGTQQPGEIEVVNFHDKAKIGSDFIIFYGYSYVYKKAITQAVQFDDIDLCDDESFAKGVLGRGYKLIAVDDPDRDCLHIIHPNSTAACYSRYSMPVFLLPTLFPGYVAPV